MVGHESSFNEMVVQALRMSCKIILVLVLHLLVILEASSDCRDWRTRGYWYKWDRTNKY